MEMLVVFAIAVVCVVSVLRFMRKLEKNSEKRDSEWAAEREADRVKRDKIDEYERKLRATESLRSISRSYMEYLARR